MKRFKASIPNKSGLDPIGPFHPYLVYASVLLLDLLALVLIVAALVLATDWIEDFF